MPDTQVMIEQDVVTRWLEELGYTAKDLKPDPRMAWQLLAILSKEYEFVVYQDADRPTIVVQRVVGLAPQHVKAISNLSAEAFSQFKFHLLRDLLLSSVDYQLELVEKKLARIMVGARLHAQSANANELLEYLNRVKAASVLAVIHVRQAAGEIE